MSAFQRMLELLPTVLQGGENIKGILEPIGREIDEINAVLNDLEGMWLATEATGDFLDLIGENIQVFRQGQTDSLYRKKIRTALYNLFFVPILDNFISYIENVLEYDITRLEEGWNMPFIKEPAYIECDVNVPPTELLDPALEFDKIYSGGVKVSYKIIRQITKPTRLCGLGIRSGIPGIFKGSKLESIGGTIGNEIIYPCGFNYRLGVQNIGVRGK